MSQHEHAGARRSVASRGGWLLAVTSRVGDLRSPFYAEERQRDVWNEASAVGLQVVLLAGTAAAAVAVWVGGAAALPYGLALLGVAALGSVVTIAHARALGVDLSAARGVTVLRWRLVPYLLLIAAFAAGAVRAAPAGGVGSGAAWGALGGAVLAVVVLGAGELRERRRAHG